MTGSMILRLVNKTSSAQGLLNRERYNLRQTPVSPSPRDEQPNQTSQTTLEESQPDEVYFMVPYKKDSTPSLRAVGRVREQGMTRWFAL